MATVAGITEETGAAVETGVAENREAAADVLRITEATAVRRVSAPAQEMQHGRQERMRERRYGMREKQWKGNSRHVTVPA